MIERGIASNTHRQSAHEHGKANKILLFGGTFDPPHIGHLYNLRHAIEVVQPDIALVMPTGMAPHKADQAAPAALRLAMCACFCDVSPCVSVSDWEIRRGGRSYTVHTLKMLSCTYPAAQLYLCLGGDMLRTFCEWYRWRDILRMATLVVQPRSREQIDALQDCARALTQQGGRVLFTGAQPLECTSTQVRALLRAQNPIAWTKLPPAAADVIRKNGLYGTRGANMPERERNISS